MKGYALLSTSAGDINGAKQAINKNISGDVKVDNISDMKMLTTLAKYLWSKDNFEFRVRVIAAVGFLVGAKVCFHLFLSYLIAVLLFLFLHYHGLLLSLNRHALVAPKKEPRCCGFGLQRMDETDCG